MEQLEGWKVESLHPIGCGKWKAPLPRWERLGEGE